MFSFLVTCQTIWASEVLFFPAMTTTGNETVHAPVGYLPLLWPVRQLNLLNDVTLFQSYSLAYFFLGRTH